MGQQPQEQSYCLVLFEEKRTEHLLTTREQAEDHHLVTRLLCFSNALVMGTLFRVGTIYGFQSMFFFTILLKKDLLLSKLFLLQLLSCWSGFLSFSFYKIVCH